MTGVSDVSLSIHLINDWLNGYFAGFSISFVPILLYKVVVSFNLGGYMPKLGYWELNFN